MSTGQAQLILQRIALAPLALFLLGAFSPALFGDPIPACAAATVSVYDADGFECTIDGYTLEDFTFSNSQTGGATLLSDSQINLVPTVTQGGVSFQFAPVDGFLFSIPSGQTAEYIFQYELDPQLPKITGGSIATGPGDPVSLTGQFCGNGTFSGPFVSGQPTSCSGTDPAGIFPEEAQVVGNNGTATYQFPVVVTDLDTRLILDLDGPASVTSFGTNVDVSPVPEPTTLLWLAPALLALVWLRQKRNPISR